jgi:hypothetical protein
MRHDNFGDESEDEPPSEPIPPPPQPAKSRRPLTPKERKQLEDQIERAKKNPNIYPLW